MTLDAKQVVVAIDRCGHAGCGHHTVEVKRDPQ
jgi:hypothetical protein